MKELFKPSKDLARLQVCNEKKVFWCSVSEGLNSSLALSAQEIFPRKNMSKLLVLASKQAGREAVDLYCQHFAHLFR